MNDLYPVSLTITLARNIRPNRYQRKYKHRVIGLSGAGIQLSEPTGPVQLSDRATSLQFMTFDGISFFGVYT